MRVFCIRRYSHGYTGFVEDEDEYAFFQFPRRGKLRKLFAHDKNDYPDYHYFVGAMSKFIPRLFFLEQPIPFEPVTIEQLDKIHKMVSDR